MRPSNCPKCQGSMAEGFVVGADRYNQYAVGSWVEGTPQKSIWFGLKLGGKPRIDVQTWRCGRCGYLESYAK